MYVTLDLGDTWQLMEKFIVQFGWAKMSKDS